MEIINMLEERILQLLEKLKKTEQENKALREQLDAERQSKQSVATRIDALLKKIQEGTA